MIIIIIAFKVHITISTRTAVKRSRFITLSGMITYIIKQHHGYNIFHPCIILHGKWKMFELESVPK